MEDKSYSVEDRHEKATTAAGICHIFSVGTMAPNDYSPVGEPEPIFQEPMFPEHEPAVDGADARKSFLSVDIHEVNNGRTTPEFNLPTANSWGESSNSTARKEEKEQSVHSQDSTSKTLQLSANGSWAFEIISLLVSAAAVAGIIVVLAHFDNRPLPDWPLNITLNTLIALLSTLANANLAIPLQSGLSQLKWIRFKAGRAPLTDMEAFDDASRGTWGAILLLVKARGG